MKKFILRFILFLLLTIIVILIPAVVIYAKFPVNYKINGLAATIDKHARLKSITGKKIIIVGGSGCGMGINSERIDSAFSDYDVVNMGLFGQLGLCYMLNEVKDDIKKGDVVVIIPEYQHFYYQYYGDLGLLRILKINPQGIHYLSSAKQWMVVMKNLGPHLFKQFGHNDENPSTISPMWDRRNVNKYGDFCGHLKLKDSIDVKQKPLFTSKEKLIVDDHVLNDLNEYKTFVESKGAQVVFMYPAIPEITYKNNAATLTNLSETMRTKVEIPVLNSPESATMNDSLFFDTVYHLNKTGRERRTSDLIRDLQKWLSNTH